MICSSVSNSLPDVFPFPGVVVFFGFQQVHRAVSEVTMSGSFDDGSSSMGSADPATGYAGVVGDEEKEARLRVEDDEQGVIDCRMRRTNGSGFAFRLNECAKKRKELNMKLEDKINSKEAEKINFYFKSKENQEQEMKRLRRRLTFKETPMPSFYGEGPPKVESKK
ncbi:hypothetical protein Droror1_Dr00027066 [Drosera rotundifolia]